jgi:hypothetical protein
VKRQQGPQAEQQVPQTEQQRARLEQLVERPAMQPVGEQLLPDALPVEQPQGPPEKVPYSHRPNDLSRCP